MKLEEGTITKLAAIICGDKEQKIAKPFMYRSSSRLSAFFANCGLDHRHGGETRRFWVADVLRSLNAEAASQSDLPSDALVAVIVETMDPDYFEVEGTSRDQALIELNSVIGRQGLVAYLDSGQCYVRHDGTGVTSKQAAQRCRPLTKSEIEFRDRLGKYLDTASEDDFTEIVLAPYFIGLNFRRVDVRGHREKTLEYGVDLWMKYQLPTSHWLYFAAQVKRVKIDASGVSNGNVGEILNQASMAMGAELFDPDIGRKVLLDHLFIISAKEITRSARAWLATRLDAEQRRRIIFMDRAELLNSAARIVPGLPDTSTAFTDEIPF